jgi:hypothetical protein
MDVPGPVVADADRFYWGVFGKIMSAPHGMLSGSQLADVDGFPYLMALDTTNIYWLVDGVFRAPLATGAAKRLGDSGPTGTISIDATHVYYLSNEGGTLSKVPIEGGDTVELATQQVLYGYSMPVDDEAVYWMMGGDRIVKVAK